jgi:hypothetical protein
MFNDRLSSEAAKERIRERMREAETYGLQKRLGYEDYRMAKWIVVLIVIVAVVAVAALL